MVALGRVGGALDVGSGSICLGHTCNPSWTLAGPWTTSGSNIYFNASANSGNVGIGTTTPAQALEVNGGVWAQGRHTRGVGYLGDMEKLNRAQLDGWTVLQCTPQQVTSGAIVPMLKEALWCLR